MATSPSPFVDHAAPILAGDPALSDDQRSNLWDAFHSKSPEELVQHLQPLAIPDDTKHQLWQAKLRSTPADPIAKISAVGDAMKSLDPSTLDLMEAHPTVFKTLATAATNPEKGSTVDSGASTSKSKGKTASGSKETPGLAPDVPATPSGHALVKASDGAMYHIPHENIPHAKALDKGLSVLHVEP